jgi:hypothetical protein
MGDTFAKLATTARGHSGGAGDVMTARAFAGFATLVLGLLALTGSAAAADRYVTPGGAGSACTQPNPCSFAVGAGDAVGGDTVHVDGDSGDYLNVSAIFAVDPGVAVVGEGAQMPRIVFSTGQMLANTGSSLTRLALSRSSGNPLVLGLVGATGSRLLLESGTGLPLEMRGSLLRDSVVRQTGENLPAIQTANDNTLRNVTAIATGAGSTAIRTFGLPAFSPPPDCDYTGTLNVRNTIARGVEWDLASTGTAAKCPAPIDIGHSNYRAGKVQLSGAGASLNDLGANQTGVEPLLAADGFRQLPGSPTIDAGTVDPLLGATDFDGQPRVQGCAPDIGADEFPSPPCPSPPGDGAPDASGSGGPPDVTAPRIRALRLKPRRFRAARRGGSVSAALGARISYRLSEAANVRFRVQRRAAGRRAGRRCVKPRRGNRGRKGCVRWVRQRGSFSRRGKAAANSLRFSGRLAGRRLRPGRYRLIAVPTDPAGNRGRAVRAGFRIVRR